MSWRDFWNGKTTIYASLHHEDVHYRLIAQDIVRLIACPASRVLDFGCGEARSAHLVARACGQLLLCDAATSVRERVGGRVRHLPNVEVIEPEALDQLPDGSLDVIVVNSVIQYLSRAELDRWLVSWRRLLSPGGRLVIGDIVPRHVGPLADAKELLKFARANGFLIAATVGLVRTALSDYRRKRAELGLLQLEEPEIAEIAGRWGFAVSRSSHNIGHNPLRLTVVATPVAPVAPSPARSPAERAQPMRESLEPATV